MIFNSLGSNYGARLAWRSLIAGGRRGENDRLSQEIKRIYGAGAVDLYRNGRTALMVAVKASGGGPVAINSLSCFSVEQAVKSAGGRAVFLDIDHQSINPYHFCLKQLRAGYKKEPRLTAVIVQNTYGWPIDIDPIARFCQQKGICLIEDLAHCPGGTYKDGRQFGTVGDYAVLSFGRGKTIDVVSGGGLIYRQAPNQRQAPIRSRTGFRTRLYPLAINSLRCLYRWPVLGKIGHRFWPLTALIASDIKPGQLRPLGLGSDRALLAREALKDLDANLIRRRRLADIYNRGRRLSAKASFVRWPISLDSHRLKTMLLRDLKRARIDLNDTWYDSPVYPARWRSESAYKAGLCPVNEALGERLINLPLHRLISPATASFISANVSIYEDFICHFAPTKRQYQAALRQFKNASLKSGWVAGEAAVVRPGTTVERVIIKQRSTKKVVGLIQAIRRPARRGCYVDVGGGPLWQAGDPNLIRLLGRLLKQIGTEAGAVFVRCQPFAPLPPELSDWFGLIDGRPGSAPINYPTTAVIDLNQPWEAIESGFKKKVYRRSQKQIRQGLVVVKKRSATEKQIDRFIQMLAATSQRQGFTPTSLAEVRQQLRLWQNSNQLDLYQALDQSGDIIAQAAIVKEADEAAYIYGASQRSAANLYGPHAIQFEAIAAARANGLKRYNLWGALPKTARPDHPLAGVSEFKRAFGGRVVNHGLLTDIVLKHSRYRLIRLWEINQQKRRGYR